MEKGSSSIRDGRNRPLHEKLPGGFSWTRSRGASPERPRISPCSPRRKRDESTTTSAKGKKACFADGKEKRRGVIAQPTEKKPPPPKKGRGPSLHKAKRGKYQKELYPKRKKRENFHPQNLGTFCLSTPGEVTPKRIVGKDVELLGGLKPRANTQCFPRTLSLRTWRRKGNPHSFVKG